MIPLLILASLGALEARNIKGVAAECPYVTGVENASVVKLWGQASVTKEMCCSGASLSVNMTQRFWLNIYQGPEMAMLF